MKRIIVFVLVLMLTLPSLSFGIDEMNGRLEGHWSKDEIDKEFLLYYFPYLAKGNFARLDPDESFGEDEFLLSFSSLLKEKGYPWSTIGWKKKLNRIEMAGILGKKLLEIEAVDPDEGELPFTDIDGISEDRRIALGSLYHAGILNGQSENRFNPKDYTTQAEAILVLQRIGTLLDEKIDEDEDEIPFQLSGTLQSYSGEEGVKYRIEEDRIRITITRSFPNPGYSMEIDKIIEDGSQYKIYLNTIPPHRDSKQLTVIVFKSITIYIDKEQLGDPPYSFIMK